MAENSLDDLIIHDLKNPLSGITSTVEMFLSKLLGPLDEEQTKYLTLIRSSARIIADQLAELQLIRDIENLRLKPQKVKVSASELSPPLAWLKEYAASQEKDLSINLADVVASADPALVSQSLQTLILHAIRQTKPNSGKIVCAAKIDGNMISFSVNYPAEPLSEEALAAIFSKSFRLDFPQLKSRAAAGLGLYFCRIASELQGGSAGIANIATGINCFICLPKA